MKRHFYVSDDLDDLELIEKELESRGVRTPQIHVISRDDSGVNAHDHLHNIESVLKKDVVHGTIVGAWIGAGLAALVLIVTYYQGWPADYTWIPFIFLAIVVLGFGAWSGGLYGIQVPHHDFKKFGKQLKEGKHVFIVDIDAKQESNLERVMQSHPKLQLAGTGTSTPRWVVMGQHNIKKFTSETFP